MAGSTCGLATFTVLIAFVAIAALVISIVALLEIDRQQKHIRNIGRSGSGGSWVTTIINTGFSSSSSNHVPNRIYTIGVHKNSPPIGYINETTQASSGYARDIISKVCQAADIECVFVVHELEDCWVTDESFSNAGQALLSERLDACSFYYPTSSRKNALMFSDSYAPAPKSAFYVAKGGSFNYTDLKGKKIGFQTHTFADESCLARQKFNNSILTKDQIVVNQNISKLVELQENGEIDAFFLYDLYVQSLNVTVDKIGGDVFCTQEGGAVMMRKDQIGLRDALNYGLAKLHEYGEWEDLCEGLKIKYADVGVVDLEC